MVIPASGPISMTDIVDEFGGSTPHSLNEYYGAAAGVPSSGTISFSDFRGKSQAQINIGSYMETIFTDRQNTTGQYRATMPADAATADLTVVAIWHNSPEYTIAPNAFGDWTRIHTTSRGRPNMSIFVAYGPRETREYVAEGVRNVGVNMCAVCFTSNKGSSSSLFSFPYIVDQWHTNSSCWNDLGPSIDSSMEVNEYYMLFFASGCPTVGDCSITYSGNTLTQLVSNQTLAVTLHSNKLYAADGTPAKWNTCMNFTGKNNNQGSYGWVMVATN